MRYQDAFSSPFLKADDFENGREVTLTIREVKVTKFKFGKKPIITFERTQKALVLNKTNATEIAQLYGDEMDNWKGKRVTLYPTMVPFGDKMVPSVKVKAPKLASVA